MAQAGAITMTTTQPQARSFQARMAQLDEAIAFVEAFCARHGVSRGPCLRLSLVVEELFTNSVEHGHGGDCDAPIRISLTAGADAVDLLYEDEAPAFDVLAHTADVDAPLPERPGGLGIRLVKDLAASARYAREDGRNRLWIALARDAA